MKTITFFLLFAPTICLAQVDWAPVGAKWWYEATWHGWNAYGITYYNLEALEEIEVQGRTCRELAYDDHGQSLCLGCEPWGNEEINYFVYSDSGRVYCFNHVTDSFGLLYDMNKGIGESWEVDFPFNSEEPSPLVITVIDTMSIVINGTRLRQQKTSASIGSPLYYFGDTITEGIGGNWSFLPQCSMHMICELDYGNLRCYEDSTLGLVHFSSLDCEYEYTYVGIGETDIRSAVAVVSPQPASHELNISWQHEKTSAISLHDMMGKELLRQQSNGQSEVLDVSKLPNGLYMLQLVQGDVVSSQKVLVQH